MSGGQDDASEQIDSSGNAPPLPILTDTPVCSCGIQQFDCPPKQNFWLTKAILDKLLQSGTLYEPRDQPTDS